MAHATDCPCDPCCNRRIGRNPDARRSDASRVTHSRPAHLIRSWSGRAADEAPICGANANSGYVPRTTGREPWDCAGNPMPLCADCLAVANKETK